MREETESWCNYSENNVAAKEGWFTYQRKEGYPTIYPPQFIPAFVDILTVGLILAFVILAICFYIILPAFNASRRRCIFVHVTISLFIGGVIVLGNFGEDWEMGKVRIKSSYKAGTGEEIEADLALHVALRGINISLKGEPVDRNNSIDLAYETIDYNEHFSWEWEQGRLGFGKYAGKFSREFRAAIMRGIPIPILQVAEYFTFDGEGIRFGRYYRLAGWYSHIMMWTAFALWIVTNILFCMVVGSGASFLILTGVVQLIAILIWTLLRNPIELSIPFESPLSHELVDGTTMDQVTLQTQFGTTYYMVLFNGGLCMVLGLFILILDMFIPDQMCQFFGIDPLTIYDEYVMTAAELKKEQESETASTVGDINSMEKGEGNHLKMVPLTGYDAREDDDDQKFHGGTTKSSSPEISKEKWDTVVLKRRQSSRLGHQIKQSFRRKPKVLPRQKLPDDNEIQRVRYEKPRSVKILGENEPLLRNKMTPESIPENVNDDEPDYDNLPKLRRHKK